MDVQRIYARRFTPDLQFRDEMWKILCRVFFQRYVQPQTHVLELGAGYCEFINNIEAKNKTAVDINPDVEKFVNKGIRTVIASTTNIKGVADNSVDLVFASNFFEHLLKDDIIATFEEVYRILVPGGRFMVLQPNIRYCARDYWMFFDHVTPIDDRAFVEALEIHGFEIIQVVDRFLPYTTKSRLPKALFLIELYLRLPIAWRLFGQQAFILSRRPE